MRVLIIGGTGNLSYACSVAALESGFEVFNLNRGLKPEQSAAGVITLTADIRDLDAARTVSPAAGLVGS